MRGGPLPGGVRAALHPLLSLLELSAADRKRVRHQPAHRSGPGEEMNRSPEPVNMPRDGGSTQTISRCPTCQIAGLSRYPRPNILLISRLHARRRLRRSARRPPLHEVRAGFGHAARSRSPHSGVLRRKRSALPPASSDSRHCRRPGRRRVRIRGLKKSRRRGISVMGGTSLGPVTPSFSSTRRQRSA